MSDEAETLAIQNRVLERENRRLRKALRDEYAMAALTGLLAHHGVELEPRVAGQYAIEYADAMLEARKEPA